MRSLCALAGLLVCAAVLPARAAAPETTDLVVIFDTSGSMNEPVRGGRKLDVAKSAMWRFVELLPKNVRVGLVTFNRGCDVKTVSPLAPATPAARGRLRSDMASLEADGSTPIGYAIAEATKLLVRSAAPRKRIVIITDGEETCAERELERSSDQAWKLGIKVYAVGFAFGATPSRNFRRIGIYKDADDETQLASVFSDIRKSLERDAKSYDESAAKDPSLAEAPAVSYKGRTGHFRASGTPRAGRLYSTLRFQSSYEPRFTEADSFTVLEHGYHVLFDEEQFTADKVEVYKVRLADKLNFAYGGAEGFVLAEDVVVQ